MLYQDEEIYVAPGYPPPSLQAMARYRVWRDQTSFDGLARKANIEITAASTPSGGIQLDYWGVTKKDNKSVPTGRSAHYVSGACGTFFIFQDENDLEYDTPQSRGMNASELITWLTGETPQQGEEPSNLGLLFVAGENISIGQLCWLGSDGTLRVTTAN